MGQRRAMPWFWAAPPESSVFPCGSLADTPLPLFPEMMEQQHAGVVPVQEVRPAALVGSLEAQQKQRSKKTCCGRSAACVVCTVLLIAAVVLGARLSFFARHASDGLSCLHLFPGIALGVGLGVGLKTIDSPSPSPSPPPGSPAGAQGRFIVSSAALNGYTVATFNVPVQNTFANVTASRVGVAPSAVNGARVDGAK